MFGAPLALPGVAVPNGVSPPDAKRVPPEAPVSETSGSPSRSGEQRYSLFHASDAAEPGLKAWHTPYADAFRGCADVLDLGCGPGFFLDLLRDRGIAGIGIDFDPAMVNAARGRGHDARIGDHAMVATFHDAFDGIHLSHVIEHLWGDDAVGLLEASYAALREGGLLIVRTPNWGNATVRHGGFWLDHTHKRPYPLELLTKIAGDLGMTTVRAGYEPAGWEDTYLLLRKPRSRARAARVRIAWHGDFLGEGSLARANRNLARAVLSADPGVDVIPFGEPMPIVEEALGLPLRRPESIPDDGVPTVTFRHRWPPSFMNPRSGYYVHQQPWEFGVVPRAWADPLTARADDVWCDTEYVRETYLAAGVPPERVHVTPLGFDPAVYNPRVEPLPVSDPQRCIFLFVGGMVDRKNVRGVVEAYLATFKVTDEVALIVKDDPAVGLYDRAPADRLRELSERTDVPPVRYVDQRYRDEDMARLYRVAAALVQPSKGEGFCLPVLEAMACGTPPIVTAGGATDDFVDSTVGWRIPAQRRMLGPKVDDLVLAGEGWVLEPDPIQLAVTMRSIYENRAAARAKGEAAAKRAHASWTWTHAAKKTIDRLDALIAAPPRPPAAFEDDLNAYEYKILSQNGEDGMLLEIFRRLRVVNPFFVEFGVESGSECNAALLARRYAWSGLMLEGDPGLFARLQEAYKELPNVRTAHAFVTRENIRDLFREHGVPLEFDLLSIDTDGNDYYLWEALEGYRPRVVVVEINPSYPPPQRWVIAYNPTHHWQHDDYYGASLASYTALGERLGYALLATDKNAVNAIFIRRDLLPYVGFPAKTPEGAFHEPAYRHPHREGPSVAL